MSFSAYWKELFLQRKVFFFRYGKYFFICVSIFLALECTVLMCPNGPIESSVTNFYGPMRALWECGGRAWWRFYWWQGLTKNGIFNHEWALFYPDERKQYRFFSNYFFYKSVLFIYYGIKRNAQLSNCKRILIFPSQFPDIPRKISAYLQASLPSVANTRNISGLCKLLNVNNLYLKGIFSHCKKHHFVLQ